MIGHFPAALLVPGLLFLAAGFYYHSRATTATETGDLGTRMAAANRHTGNISIAFGLLLIAIAVGLGIAIQQLLQSSP